MKITRILLCAFLVLAMMLGLCACGGEETNVSDSDEGSTESTESVNNESEAVSADGSEAESADESTEEVNTFVVTVVDNEGNVVSGVMVQICKDSCLPAMTNAEGQAVFNAEITDGYKLSVMSCPAGYTYEGDAEVYLESGSTEYTLTLTKAAE